MKRTTSNKALAITLQLTRETIRQLDDAALESMIGGKQIVPDTKRGKKPTQC
jgi:hypothetical protein